MTIFQIAAVLLTFAALGGYLNAKFIGLPASIGHMVFALVMSLIAIGLGKFDWFSLDELRPIVHSIQFDKVLLHGMLGFLLFAGALHIDLSDLHKSRYPVIVLATVGVAIAIVVTGSLTWVAADAMGVQLPYIYALLFGALIAPTDPIAVLSLLKQANAPKNLYIKIGGESLFNDGVGVVAFVIILNAAIYSGPIRTSDVVKTLAWEGIGALVLGTLSGYIVYRLLRSIDDYKIEAMLTLALAAGGYALAESIHLSAPIFIVAAGLVVGNQGRTFGMSARNRASLDLFWELIDEILNAILFLLIGIGILVIPLNWGIAALGLLATGAVLTGRFVSVALPITLMRLRRHFDRGTIRLLTWGGLRGGISIALALSIPNGPEKDIILPVTYMVVLFSILVQGLSFRRVIRLVLGPSAPMP